MDASPYIDILGYFVVLGPFVVLALRGLAVLLEHPISDEEWKEIIRVRRADRS